MVPKAAASRQQRFIIIGLIAAVTGYYLMFSWYNERCWPRLGYAIHCRPPVYESVKDYENSLLKQEQQSTLGSSTNGSHRGRKSTEAAARNHSGYIGTTMSKYQGFGNQMFIYASLFGIARRFNRMPFIIDYESSAHFFCAFSNLKIPLVRTIPSSIKRHLKNFNQTQTNGSGSLLTLSERNAADFDQEMMANISRTPCSVPIMLNGYLQSYRYFDPSFSSSLNSTTTTHLRNSSPKYSDDHGKEGGDGGDLWDQFGHFVPSISGELCQNKTAGFRQKILNHCQLIGVHVRRGDYLVKGNVDHGFLPADEDYIRRAMQYFEATMSPQECFKFVFFGREADWSAENFGSDSDKILEIVRDQFPQAVDLCIMAQMDHFILTTGTFGWWAAWLVQKRTLGAGVVIYQKDFATPLSHVWNVTNPPAHFPPNWIPM